MEMTNFKGIPLYSSENGIETGKYTTLFTDVGNFEINMSLEDLLKVISESQGGLFKYKKLEEYSKVLEHYGELILDLKFVKIMGYKEHTIIDNLNERAKIDAKNNLEVKN